VAWQDVLAGSGPPASLLSGTPCLTTPLVLRAVLFPSQVRAFPIAARKLPIPERPSFHQGFFFFFNGSLFFWMYEMRSAPTPKSFLRPTPFSCGKDSGGYFPSPLVFAEASGISGRGWVPCRDFARQVSGEAGPRGPPFSQRRMFRCLKTSVPSRDVFCVLSGPLSFLFGL